MVKTQYHESSGSEFKSYTLMDKVSVEADDPRGRGKWQFKSEYGECSNYDAGQAVLVVIRGVRMTGRCFVLNHNLKGAFRYE